MKLTNETQLADKSRRKFIRGFSLFVGGTAATTLLTGNAIAVAMEYSPKSDSTLTAGKIFTRAQLIQLKQICSIVIPATDTLGAAEIDTHGFIDNQLYHCHEKVDQDKAVEVLVLIEQSSSENLGTSFTKLTEGQQFQLLTDLDQGKGVFNQVQRELFKSLKQLICFGYYTSEVGATQELRYDPVPGGFKGSVPYKDTDPTWATKGLFE